MQQRADLEELLAILDLRQVDDDTVHRLASEQEPDPDVRRPDDGAGVRRRVAARVSTNLPPSALSVHFIAGGDPEPGPRVPRRARCATSADSPTGGSTSCRTACCWRRRWSSHLSRWPRARARTSTPPSCRPRDAAADRRSAARLREDGAALRRGASAHRVALRQRSGLGDAGQGRAARPQPRLAQGRGRRCPTIR